MTTEDSFYDELEFYTHEPDELFRRILKYSTDIAYIAKGDGPRALFADTTR